MRIRRTFTREFKRQSAEAIISGQISPLDLSRKYMFNFIDEYPLLLTLELAYYSIKDY